MLLASSLGTRPLSACEGVVPRLAALHLWGSLVPRPLPDFISAAAENSPAGCKIKSESGLGLMILQLGNKT